MAGVTDDYGLILVDEGEAYDEEVFNTNMKTIAAALKGFPFKTAVGKKLMAISAGEAFVSETIALPAGFTVAPIVNATIAGNVAGRASLLKVSAFSETTGNFVLKMQTSDNANIGTSYNINVNWIAVQRASNSAVG